MPIPQEKLKSAKISHNMEQPIDLKEIYERVKKKKLAEEIAKLEQSEMENEK